MYEKWTHKRYANNNTSQRNNNTLIIYTLFVLVKIYRKNKSY